MYNNYYPYNSSLYPDSNQSNYGYNFRDQTNTSYNPLINEPIYGARINNQGKTPIRDYGPQPLAININNVTKQNNTYRTALWTGNHLQVTLMSINVGDDIGLEIHPDTDQFLRIEDGQGLVKMGKDRDRLDYQMAVGDDFAIMVPAGTWHNVINTGNKPLKLYTIYAPPHHPFGTVHVTKADAEAQEMHRYY